MADTESPDPGPTDELKEPDLEERFEVPPVVAIMVSSNPGAWFEETLASFRDQDYENLAVLIIDAASVDDPLPRVAEVLPSAYVRRLERNPGYAAASNRALRIVHGASHLLFCHDDIAFEPTAIRRMVEEAFRSNAGIVTPKFVDWDDPSQLLSMGGTVDTTGSFIPLIDRDDRDQGQHDTVNEVFIASGGALLVRADLFSALGGFDAAMALYGEDIDLSWRAQVVGAHVVAAPHAIVRHKEASSRGLRLTPPSGDQADDVDGESSGRVLDEMILKRRHQLRSVLKIQTGLELVGAVTRQVIVNVLEVLYGWAAGKPENSNAVIASWTWNISHWRGLMKLRAELAPHRIEDQHELKKHFASTRARISGVARNEWEAWRESTQSNTRGREFAVSLRQLPFLIWVGVFAIWIIGSRRILSGGLSILGQFAPLPDGPVTALKEFFGVWPAHAFGNAVSESPGYLFTAAGGFLFFGAMGVFHKALILGMLPIGVFGMARLARPLKSRRAKLMVVIAYAAVPVPYESIALGRWDGLLCYAAAPWLLSRLLRVNGSAPFVGRRGALHFTFRRDDAADEEELASLVVGNPQTPQDSVTQLRRAAALLSERQVEAGTAVSLPTTEPFVDRIWFLAVRRVFPLAILLAVIGTFAPQFISASLVVSALMVLTSVASGDRGADRLRTVAVALCASLAAALLILPATLSGPLGWKAFYTTSISTTTPDGFGTLLGMHAGGFSTSIMTFGLFIAALPALLFGKEWRFHLAVRLWVTTLVLVGLTWLGADGRFGSVIPDPHVWLPIAGAALALNVGLSALAVQEDLRKYTFGWRQATPAVVVVAMFFALIPILGKSLDGAWHTPAGTTSELLSWLPSPEDAGSYRVLWLGDSAAMPDGPTSFGKDLSAAVTVDGPTGEGPVGPTKGGLGEAGVENAVAQARDGKTVTLGQLLSAYSVRYIVVPSSTGASDAGGEVQLPPPSDVVPSLSSQLDLKHISTDQSLAVYENTKWIPIRTPLTPAEALGVHRDPNSAATTPLYGVDRGALDDGGSGTWTGGLYQGDLYVGEAQSDSWQLTVNGRSQEQSPAFGWAQSFAITSGGHGRLHYSPPGEVIYWQIVDALGWALIVLLSVRYRPRRGRYT